MELTCISPDEVYLNGHLLDPKPSQKRHNHSPTGFMWGYGGSGPAQLALAVMMKMLEGTGYHPDYEDGAPQSIEGVEPTVKKHYQDFKSDVIANLPIKPVALEFDFWAWFHGEPAEKSVILLKELDEPAGDIGEKYGECSFPERCQKADWKQCDCTCGGSNHGIQTRMFPKSEVKKQLI